MSASSLSFVLLVLIFSVICSSTLAELTGIGLDRPTYLVHVINGFKNNSSPLSIPCQSKDDDIGEHTLYVGNEISWHFKVNFIGTMLFFCHARWDGKDMSFNVFRAILQNSNETQKVKT